MKLSNQSKLEWFYNVTYTSIEDPNDDGLTIFKRSHSALEGYYEAVAYTYYDDMVVHIPAFTLIEEIHYYYPDENFFGYYKSVEYQSPQKVIHNHIKEIPSELFLKNYHAVILWMESLEDDRFQVVRVKSRIDGLEYWGKGKWKEGREFKLEESWIDEVLFYSYYLVDSLIDAPVIYFKVKPYAPIETYAVYEEDNIYPLYYKLDIEDLTYWIKIDSKKFHL